MKKKTLDELSWKNESIINLYKTRLQRKQENSSPLAGIVFSKDRALQLHALLASYFEQATSAVQLHILYRTSTPEHEQSYREVKRLFPKACVSFYPQKSSKSFREDLLAIIDNLQTKKVFFLVDDMVFIEPFDLEDFLRFETDHFVPSLRMGMNLTRCYTQQREQDRPAEVSICPEEKDKFVWLWEEGVCDWGYPLSVDGHLFSTGEIRSIAHQIRFHNPNSFEEKLQHFRRLFSCRYGICYRKSKTVNIPCNKVQQENNNLHGDIHQEYLLDQWMKGMQMDFRKLYGFKNRSAHQEIIISLVPRL